MAVQFVDTRDYHLRIDGDTPDQREHFLARASRDGLRAVRSGEHSVVLYGEEQEISLFLSRVSAFPPGHFDEEDDL